MPSRLFGQYLMEKGLITKEMFLEAIEMQSTIDLPLCALAISKGCLTEEQLVQLDAAGESPAASPLERAIRAEMLTLEQLEELSRAPAQRGLSFGEALIKKGFLSLLQFGRAYAEYQRDCPDQPVIRSKLPVNITTSHRDIVNVFLDAFVDIFVHYTKQVIRVASTSTELPRYDHTLMWTFRQKVYTDVHFHVILSIPEPIMQAIGMEMLGREVTSVDNLVVDAVSEFLNVFTGNACGKLSEAGVSFRTTPPAVVHGARAYPPKPTEVVTLNMETMKGSLSLIFAFTDVP